MTPPKETIWKLDPHTKAKHEILRRYLSKWFPILGKYNDKIVYIDGFCGPGKFGEYDGSPIIALKLAKNYFGNSLNKNISFLFIEEDKDRLESLKNEIKVINPPPNFHINAILNSFENVMKEIFADLETKKQHLAPTFAFIDPFGFKGIPLTLIRKILSNEKTEVFINFNQNSINRFLECNNPITEQYIRDLLGSSDACNTILNSINRKEKLKEVYFDQLKTCAKFVKYFEMKNKQNHTVYYLFFATNNPLGYVKMKEAFWDIDPENGFYFSDLTNTQQMVLFKNDPTLEVKKIILEKFMGKTILGNQIRCFIENYTDFLASHMRKALLELENEKGIVVNGLKSDGTKRRAGTFPDLIEIKFN